MTRSANSTFAVTGKKADRSNFRLLPCQADYPGTRAGFPDLGGLEICAHALGQDCLCPAQGGRAADQYERPLRRITRLRPKRKNKTDICAVPIGEMTSRELTILDHASDTHISKCSLARLAATYRSQRARMSASSRRFIGSPGSAQAMATARNSRPLMRFIVPMRIHMT